jgi:metal-responsive CopG/Arc/MetJ family transcriptional regulator
MDHSQILKFSCPADLVRRLDAVADEELLSRADVIRRAVRWELRAAEGYPLDRPTRPQEATHA